MSILHILQVVCKVMSRTVYIYSTLSWFILYVPLLSRVFIYIFIF